VLLKWRGKGRAKMLFQGVPQIEFRQPEEFSQNNKGAH